MLENRDSHGGIFLFKSIEFLNTKPSKINPNETIVEFQVNGKTFETSVSTNNEEAFAALEKDLVAGKTVHCTFCFPADVVDGPSVAISADLQYKNGFLRISRV